MVRSKQEMDRWLAEVRVLDDVVALPPAAPRAGKTVQGAALPEGSEAYERAGWQFAPSEAAQEGAPAAFTPVVPPEGGLALLGPQLQVRFVPELSEAQIRERLAALGAEPVRAIGFAPNAWIVRVPRAETLGVLRRLNADDTVLYAEPVLVEGLGRRAR